MMVSLMRSNIALYAFAGYRLMPSLQLIHASITQLNFAHSAVKKLHEDLLENELSKSEFLRDNGQTIVNLI